LDLLQGWNRALGESRGSGGGSREVRGRFSRAHTTSKNPRPVSRIQAYFTYLRTWEGWLYLSFVLDTYSKRVLGWSMANNLRTELVLDAVNMAIYTRRPSPGLIHHSDRGSHHTSVEFGSRLREEGLLASMGSVADAYDNSLWSRASFPRSSGR
jgi:transposase InsO family protein